MLEYLKIKGKTITADAMHCQKETCETRGLCFRIKRELENVV